MSEIFHIFDVIFTYPITNILVVIYNLLSSIGVPYAFGFSIIALTFLIRLILYPLTASQIRSAVKMHKVSPHMAAIRAKHKGDIKRQQEEIMKLYKEHGVNPAAGCLPVLAQLPVTIALYNTLIKAVSINTATALTKINGILYFDSLKLQRVWDTSFFGLQLADSPSKIFAQAPLIVLVPVATGVFQFFLSKMMMPHPDDAIITPVVKDKKQDDFQTAFQKQSLFLFPAMIGFFSFSLPLGLSLYWNAFTIFGILQQYLVAGPGAAAPYFKKVKLHGRNK